MYKFTHISKGLKVKMEDVISHYPPEMCQELTHFLNALEATGQVSKSDFYRGGIIGISANTFDLNYVVDHAEKTIKFIELKLKPLGALRERFSINNSWDDKDVVEIIPQCDPPAKILKAIGLIRAGISDSYELGKALGHQGSKKRYVSRHGQYTMHALECLKLIVRQKQGRKLIPILTERGRSIAEANDINLKQKMLTVAMLNYHPIWRIIEAITNGEDELNDNTLQMLTFPEELRDSDTCPRRAQTLKSWVRWISDVNGIPIRLPGGVKQLSLQFSYGESINSDV
jgi:hypothetical protein